MVVTETDRAIVRCAADWVLSGARWYLQDAAVISSSGPSLHSTPNPSSPIHSPTELPEAPPLPLPLPPRTPPRTLLSSPTPSHASHFSPLTNPRIGLTRCECEEASFFLFPSSCLSFLLLARSRCCSACCWLKGFTRVRSRLVFFELQILIRHSPSLHN